MLGATTLFAHHFNRATRAVLVVDVVESVRLIEQDEEGAVHRWLEFADEVQANILPRSQGRLVKRLGDGMLIEFKDVASAVSASLAIQQANQEKMHALPPERQMLVRVGIETSDILVEENDVYGRGVNLATRLTSLAGPGEIVVSERVRDQLTPAIDADVEDLGNCYLKHIEHPVRAYRIGPPGPHPVVRSGARLGELLPSIAVIPFAELVAEGEHHIIGEILAEEIIRALSRSANIHVISRLSTMALRGRVLSTQQIGAYLDSNYVLSGNYRVLGDEIALDAELEEFKSKRIIWSKSYKDSVGSILSHEGELIGRIAVDVCIGMIARELQRSRSQPLPTLDSYTLLLSAITLMHRMSPRSFDEAFHMLETVIERSSRQAIPQAWIAQWHVLRVQQGWSGDPRVDADHAMERARQALDADPECSLALAVEGLVQTQMFKRLDLGQASYEQAIDANPSDSIAWLLKGTMHAFKGEGSLAVDHTERARRLSPLDPHRYFYDSLTATAYLAAHQYGEALELARRSLRVNRQHASTLRAMAIAQWRLGHRDDARKTVVGLLKIEPQLTVGRYLARTPAADYSTGREWAATLLSAGVPQ